MPAKLTPEQQALMQHAQALLPMSIMQLIKRALTLRGALFFQFYIDLKSYELGTQPVPPDLRNTFQKLVNYLAQIQSPVDHKPLSPLVINHLAESRAEMGMLLGRLVAGRLEDNSTWGKINDVMIPLILETARDKGVYLAARQTGQRRWATFRKMAGRQEDIEKLKDTNPEAYAVVHRYNQTLAQIDDKIEKKILKSGLTPEKSFIAGSPVHIAEDPVTKERMVYDRDGEVLPVADYIKKRQTQRDADKYLALIPERTQVPLHELKKLTDEEVDAIPGDVEMASMSDDRAKQGKLTRIFATKRKPVYINDSQGRTRVEARAVITSGRFKGVFLDDMVNGEGRMIEGTAFSFNQATGRSGKMPVRIDPAQREPYVTTVVMPVTYKTNGAPIKVDETRLYVRIPPDRKYSNIREQMKRISCNSRGSAKGCVPSIVWDEHKGHAAGFYFDAKDFSLINETLQGLSLSSGALAVVQDYYKDLGNAEAATAKENLAHYSAAQLGGFKTSRKNRETGEMEPFDLLTAQKKVLAWMDANGNKGVCALDCGVGKSLSAISTMQKMSRDGLDAPDAQYKTPTGQTVKTNGKYLFVCPAALRGNLPKEIRGFLHEPDSLLKKVDIMSYPTFSGASRSKKWKGQPWDPAEYVAIFFDEAQKLLKPSSGVSQAALKLWHPHKICLTASPMEKNPMEAYIMAAISNNTPLFGRSAEATKNRSDLRKFKDRYCEVVGGRIVGIKQDPLTKRDLNTWVRKNIFYVDKKNVEEFALPKLTSETVAVEMHPTVEHAYRTVTTQFAKMTRGMVAKFRDKGKHSDNPDAPNARDPRVEKAFSLAFRPVIKLLNELSNSPAKAMGTMAQIMETGKIDNKPVPKFLLPLIEAWEKAFTPDHLRTVSKLVSNPKMEAAENRVRDKLDKTDGSCRTLLFSDDKDMCVETAQHMAKTIAGKHAVGLPQSINLFDGSGELKEMIFEIDPVVLDKLVKDPEEREKILKSTGGISRHELPFGPRPMRRFPEIPAGEGNTHYKKEQWQEFVMKEVMTPDDSIRTLTLHGPTYSLGQNLQAFDTVIHLDRDTWNSEMMKQRTARAWRQGQNQPVDEVTIDATYQNSTDEFDKTLDEIRGYFQKMDSDIFTKVIQDSMDVDLGEDWKKMHHQMASTFRLDRKMVDLIASPYSGRSEPPGM